MVSLLDVNLLIALGGRLATLERKIQALVPRGHKATEVVCAILEE